MWHRTPVDTLHGMGNREQVAVTAFHCRLGEVGISKHRLVANDSRQADLTRDFVRDIVPLA
jgi:hypothetical protein